MRVVCVCVCERERERERQGHITVESAVFTVACVQIHTSIINVSVTWLCSPLGLELMVKLRTLLTVFIFTLKAEARDYGKGCYISDAACGVRPITMHWVSWPIRADCACRKEGLCRKRPGQRGNTIMYSIWKIMCFLNIKACQHILLHQTHKIMIFKMHHMTPLTFPPNCSRRIWYQVYCMY